MTISLKITEVEVKPKKMKAVVTVELNIESDAEGQKQLANALIYTAYKHLAHGQIAKDGFDLPPFGPYCAYSGSVNWNVEFEDGGE